MDLAGQSKPNKKRPQRKDEHRPDPLPQRKSQRLLAKSQPSLKITDLIDDCSEKVFEHLDLHSLFNVAVANAWLRPAAAIAYKRKFGNKTVCIANYGNEIYETADSICVRGLKKCLQFLRCLDSSISNLTIPYCHLNEKQCEYIRHYLNNYCAGSLVKIEFVGRSITIPIEQFEKPFSNVRTMKLSGGTFDDKIPLFLQWFPNVCKLELESVYTLCWIAIDRSPMHHLEELRFDLRNNRTRIGFSESEAQWLLQLCQKIRDLEIDLRHYYDDRLTLKYVLDVINESPTIRNLKVNSFCDSRLAYRSEVQQIVDEHPSLVELSLLAFIFTEDDAITLIHQLTSLKRFHFRIADRVQYDHLVAQLDTEWRPTSRDDGNHVVTLERQN